MLIPVGCTIYIEFELTYVLNLKSGNFKLVNHSKHEVALSLRFWLFTPFKGRQVKACFSILESI